MPSQGKEGDLFSLLVEIRTHLVELYEGCTSTRLARQARGREVEILSLIERIDRVLFVDECAAPDRGGGDKWP